jgi:hypothetical protein
MQNPQDPTSFIPRTAFAAYCGEKSEKLLAYYDRTAVKKKMVFQMNWLALLAFPAWCGYRRQWPLLLVWLVFAILVSSLNSPPSALLGTSVAFGLMSNNLLLMMAGARYQKLKREGLDETTIQENLRNRAAPSTGRAVGYFVVALACLVLSVLLIAILNPGPEA